MESLGKQVSVRFVLMRSKENKEGKCPLSCRITFDGKRKPFSTGIFVKPEHWNAKKQSILGTCFDYKQFNRKLQLIRSKVLTAQLELEVRDGKYDVTDIVRLVKGEKEAKNVGLIEFYEDYLKRSKALIGLDIKESTWNKFFYICKDLERFIYIRYKKKDIPISSLDIKFIDDLEYYYKVTRKLKQVTINKKLQRLKKVIKQAIAHKLLNENPFLLHKAKRVNREVVFLSQEELKKVKEFSFVQSRLGVIRDLFVFSCYTGLGYIEAMSLSKDHIVKGFDGNLWIQMKRQKTSKAISVPLLPEALEIIERYSNSESKVLPQISNQRYNSYLKEIAHIIGINKRMTTHMARRTFASTVLLYNDVPMEIVSELLGHSSMKITQESYGKVVQLKVSEQIEKLKQSKSK